MLQGKTLKAAAEELGLTTSEYCKLVYGDRVLPDIKIDMSTTIEATCHRCETKFERHPIIGVAFPAYVCSGCILKDQEVPTQH